MFAKLLLLPGAPLGTYAYGKWKLSLTICMLFFFEIHCFLSNLNIPDIFFSGLQCQALTSDCPNSNPLTSLQSCYCGSLMSYFPHLEDLFSLLWFLLSVPLHCYCWPKQPENLLAVHCDLCLKQQDQRRILPQTEWGTINQESQDQRYKTDVDKDKKERSIWITLKEYILTSTKI